MTNLEMMKNAATNTMVEGKEMLMNPPYAPEVEELIKKVIETGEAQGDAEKIETLKSELHILEGDSVCTWNFDKKIWEDISDKEYEAYHILCEENGGGTIEEWYDINEELLKEHGIDIDVNDIWDWRDGLTYLTRDVFFRGSVGYHDSIYINYDPHTDNYIICGYKIGFGGEWMRNWLTDIRYIDTYYDVYGIEDKCWMPMNPRALDWIEGWGADWTTPAGEIGETFNKDEFAKFLEETELNIIYV